MRTNPLIGGLVCSISAPRILRASVRRGWTRTREILFMNGRLTSLRGSFLSLYFSRSLEVALARLMLPLASRDVRGESARLEELRAVRALLCALVLAVPPRPHGVYAKVCQAEVYHCRDATYSYDSHGIQKKIAVRGEDVEECIYRVWGRGDVWEGRYNVCTLPTAGRRPTGLHHDDISMQHDSPMCFTTIR